MAFQKYSSFLSLSFIVSFSAWAGKPYPGPPGGLETAAEKQQLFEQYCVGKHDSPEIPEVNYGNTLVNDAASALSEVLPETFLLYSGQRKIYNTHDSKGRWRRPPRAAPRGTLPQAHAFLKVLCGEFRDRPSMIEAKLRWYRDLKTLDNQLVKKADFDVKKNLWDLLDAYSYGKFLETSDQIFSARESIEREKSLWLVPGQVIVKKGKVVEHQVQRPVEPFTICELKFIAYRYLSEAKDFTSLSSHDRAYQRFKERCHPVEDLGYYLDFRGDSNFKPNSPESNGMIWHGDVIAGRLCDSPSEANSRSKKQGARDEDCTDYFTRPFESRWNAARAGMGAWLLGDDEAFRHFWDTDLPYHLRPNQRSTRYEPFAYSLEEGYSAKILTDFVSDRLGMSDSFHLPDMGLNQGARKTGNFVGFIYERLSSLVERHTLWENAGYYDTRGYKNEGFYSPLVASSYEVSLSDHFTQPVLTLNRPKGMVRKNLMFVFKVKKENWYNSERLRQGDEINFDTMWFDEMSLGRSGRALDERAWDRLGTALEDELYAVVLLKNITSLMAAKYEYRYHDDDGEVVTDNTKCEVYAGGDVVDPDGLLRDVSGQYVTLGGDLVNRDEAVHVSQIEKLLTAELSQEVPENCLEDYELDGLISSKLLGL